MSGVRQWVRADGLASVMAGVVAVELGAWPVGLLFVVCGLDSVLVAALPERRFPAGLRLLAVGQETAFLVAFAVGAANGWSAADAAMVVVTAGVAVVARLELRAARSLAPTTLSAVGPRSSGDRASVS